MEKRWTPTEKDAREARLLWRRTRSGRDLILGDDITVKAVAQRHALRPWVRGAWQKLLAKYPRKR